MPALAVPLLSVLLPSLQDEEALKRGRDYLERLGERLLKEAPIESRNGLYMGRKWIGRVILTARKAPEGSGAALELTADAELSIPGADMKRRSRALVKKNLEIIRCETSWTINGRETTRTTTVENGRWRQVTKRGERESEKDGEFRIGTTWNVVSLFLLSRTPPEQDEIEFWSVDLGSGTVHVRVRGLAEKETRRIGDGELALRRVELQAGGDEKDVFFCDDKGRLVEFLPSGLPGKARPIPREAEGKDLEEPLQLSGPEKAIAALFIAIKKGDLEGIRAAFDFEQLAGRLLKDYGNLDGEAKKKRLESFREDFIQKVSRSRLRETLPEAEVIPDYLSESLETREEAGTARVRFGRQVWLLHRVQEGDRKGEWLITGVE